MPKTPFSSASPVIQSKLSEQEYDTISKLFKTRGRAIAHHNRLLDEDGGDADQSAFHSIPRHGPQTGWEAQLMRLVTGRTPDQSVDPFGVADAVKKYEDYEAADVTERGRLRMAPANSVGAFLNAEVEVGAINKARNKASKLMAYSFAETRSRRGAVTWTPYKYIDCVVTIPQSCAGVSFFRSKHQPPLDTADAVQAIKDFMNSKRVPSDPTSTRKFEDVNDIIRDAEGRDDATSFTYYRASVKKDFSLRFPSMQDLLDYLNVSALWMRYVNVCFRRVTKDDWKVHTAYAVGARNPSALPATASAEERHEDELAQGFDARPYIGPSVKTGKWTGNLRKVKNGAVTYIDPANLL